jgi:hypothetical protein
MLEEFVEALMAIGLRERRKAADAIEGKARSSRPSGKPS